MEMVAQQLMRIVVLEIVAGEVKTTYGCKQEDEMYDAANDHMGHLI